jgi:DNA-binding MarR family transcriptional regulator
MDNRSKIELELISALEHDPKVSQKKLAKRLAIAAGLVNILIKRAVMRGTIKMTQVPARRYAYYLTPKGFTEKAKLVARYLDTSLSLYRKLCFEYRDIFANIEARGITHVTLVGDVDIAELGIMASFGGNVSITSLVNSDTNKSTVGPVPVYATLDDIPADDKPQAVIICDARSPQACFDELATRLPVGTIFFPDAFHIVTPNDNEAI